MSRLLVTLLGNVAIDRVNGGAATPGGAPAFLPEDAAIRGCIRVVTRCALGDRPFFDPLVGADDVDFTLLESRRTNAFDLTDDGKDRQLVVTALGDTWTPDDIDVAHIETEWVHLAPLLRGEFSNEALAHLVHQGHKLSYDGQGLVRRRSVGPLHLDAHFDANDVGMLTVLKLAEEEAAMALEGVLPAGGPRRFAAPETLVTYGAEGCDLETDAGVRHFPAALRVERVHSTGAGDVFILIYTLERARGVAPSDAVELAAEQVASMLERRRS